MESVDTTQLEQQPAVNEPTADGAPGAKSTRRRGGQVNNTNALRHGLTLGSASVADPTITRHCGAFRRAQEAAVQALRGSISLADAAAIQTITRLERHCLLAQKWLRDQGDKLTPTEKLKFSREVTQTSLERDRRLKALGIVTGNAKPASLFDAVHNPLLSNPAQSDTIPGATDGR